jgi:penicillin-binding protein 2
MRLLGPRVTFVVCASLVSLLVADEVPARSRRHRHASRARYTAPHTSRALDPPLLIAASDASAHDRVVGDACVRALAGRRGSIVAMDPNTGRVLAFVNPDVGLWHAYTPCSVFKIVVAIGGLSEGLITPSTVYNCSGRCWTWPGHGPIDLRRALAVSCNPYFEWIGEQLGYEKIRRYAGLLGLGEASGINLTGECPGVVPEDVRPSRVGHLSSHASGITASVAQIAVLLSATLNGGVIYQPQIAGPEGFTPKARWQLPQGTRFDGLTDGFLAAVNEGSAITAFDPDVIVGGKTGSCARLGWFASYYLANEKPDLVVVVFLRPGNGHMASAVAGQIYREVYKPTPLPAGSAVLAAPEVIASSGGQ